MDIDKVIADITFAIYSDHELISENMNPFMLYEEEFQGNLLDIGCGQSPVILEMLHTPLNFHAIDPDKKQIEYLIERIERLSPGREIHTYKEPFKSGLFPEVRFNYIVMSNLLHLKIQMPHLEEFINDVEQIMAAGARVLVIVHAGEDKGSDRFRYFSIEDLELLFPRERYSVIYKAQHWGDPPKFNIRFGERYCSMVLDEADITDPIQRRIETDAYNEGNDFSSISFMAQRIL